MTLEQQIQTMYEKYPDLFQTRKQCLDHLFCVVGNGYEWHNGELVHYDCVNETWDNEFIYELDENGKSKEPMKFDEWFEATTKILKEMLEIFPNDDNIKNSIEKYQWYPLSKKYSYLYNYPKDIKKDWLKGIEETKQLLKEDGVEI